VVTHEALARYVRTNSPRPTIVKLHGDAHIDPKNLQPETRQLDQSLRTQLYPFLQDHALIFIGYGGNDESILKFVRECPVPALAPAIYWVSEREAPSDFNKWLSERNAIRVDHTDFDQLMHLIRNALRLELIDRKRWTQIGDRYYEAFETLREKIEKLGAASEDTVALKIATSEAEATLPDDWHYVRRARRALGNNNPDDAEQILLEGLQAYPESRRLNFDYAEILAGVRKNFDQANIYYQRAVAADPKNELSLIGYADFLSKRNELDQAEIYYRRAVDTNPESARAATWYAGFLNNYRNDANAAEVQFKRAVELDPKFTFGLITYALFLKNAGDMDGAENYYQRAIETDPKYAFALSEYALFLQNVRGKMDEAEKYFKRAVEAEPNYKYGLSEYARFLAEVRMNIPEAELYFKRSIEADPTNEMLRTVYDQFLARKSDKSKVS
jgi:tetratricopeptide (TPR) repeat protein